MQAVNVEGQMIEALLAATVHKLADGELEISADDLLAVEGMTFRLDDIPGGFLIRVSDDD